MIRWGEVLYPFGCLTYLPLVSWMTEASVLQAGTRRTGLLYRLRLAPIGCFPQLGVPFGVLRIRYILCWGFYWSPIWGKYQFC